MGIIKVMSDLDKNNNEQASFDPAPDTAFIREKIKQKPINKKKLLRRTLLTALTAVIFGGVACVTFFVLEPFLADRISTKPETQEPEIATVSFPETTDTEEMLPEDMYANDSEMIEEVVQSNIPDVSQDIQNIEDKISSIQFGLNDYQEVYSQMRTLSDVVSKSMVTVTGIHSEKDFWDNTYENNNQVSGVIIADNGPALLVLAKDTGISQAETIVVTFWDGTERDCTLLGRDAETEFMVLSVPKVTIPTSTLDAAVPITFGSSRTTALKGMPVIAIGAISGMNDSISCGMISSEAQTIYKTDAEYTIMSTNIIGASNSSGMLINLRGNVVGIIDNSVRNDDESGLIYAYGISELKPLFEKIANRETRAYLGVLGVDVSGKVRSAYGLPEGVVLGSVEIDSPAMAAGIQNGDILVSIDGVKCSTFHELLIWLETATPGDTVNCEIARQSVDSYTTLDVEIQLGEKEYSPIEKEKEE